MYNREKFMTTDKNPLDKEDFDGFQDLINEFSLPAEERDLEFEEELYNRKGTIFDMINNNYEENPEETIVEDVVFINTPEEDLSIYKSCSNWDLFNTFEEGSNGWKMTLNLLKKEYKEKVEAGKIVEKKFSKEEINAIEDDDLTTAELMIRQIEREKKEAREKMLQESFGFTKEEVKEEKEFNFQDEIESLDFSIFANC